jgi:hypothetical protein
MRIAIVAPLFLAACAAQPRVPLEVQAARMDNVELCYTVLVQGHPVGVAEARRRGIDCRDYIPLVQAAMQDQTARRAAANANINALIQPGGVLNPTFTPMQSPVRCRSYQLGNTVQTDCR